MSPPIEVCDQDSSLVDVRRRKLAIILMGSTYLVLLGGQIDLPRLGLPFEIGVPLHTVAVAVLLVILTPPAWVAIGTKSARAGYRDGSITLFVFGLLAIALLLSSLWTPYFVESSSGLLALLSMCGLAYLGYLAVRLDRAAAVAAFMICAFVAGIIFAGVGLLAAGSVARISAFGGGPNVFSRITGMGVIGLVYLVMTRPRSSWLLIGVVPLGMATILSGSRGSMLGLLAALAIFMAAARIRFLGRALVVLVLTAPLSWVLYSRFGTYVSTVIDSRIIRLTLEDGYVSGRDDLWAHGIAMFEQRPLIGWGLDTFIAENGTYPHNLFLQVATDLGAVGLVLLSIGLVAVVVDFLRRDWRAADVVAPMAGAVLIFVASQFSGGYYDTRYMWLFVLLVCTAPRRNSSTELFYPGGSGTRSATIRALS